MLFEGCQGRPSIKIEEKPCPKCGHMLEIFSVDASVTCENCGFVVYNDAFNCAEWCEYARECVGDERYEQLTQLAASQKERRREGQESLSKMDK